jgi:4-oxalocrotonate tautomerase
MPLVRIDLKEGKSAEFRSKLGALVHESIVAALNVPAADRFQVITEYKAENQIADPTYLDIQRTADCVFIQVTLNAGRTVDVKKAFYADLAQRLHDGLAIRKEDVLINLVEAQKVDWSFGNGVAQYA